MVPTVKLSRLADFRPLLALGVSLLLVAGAMRWLFVMERDNLIRPQASTLERELFAGARDFLREIADSQQDAAFLAGLASREGVSTELAGIETLFAHYLEAHAEFRGAFLLDGEGRPRFRVGDEAASALEAPVGALAGRLRSSGYDQLVTFVDPPEGPPHLRSVYTFPSLEGYIVLDLDLETWADFLGAQNILLVEEQGGLRPQPGFARPAWWREEAGDLLPDSLSPRSTPAVRQEGKSLSAYLSLLPPEGTLFVSADELREVSAWHLVARRDNLLADSGLPLLTYSMFGVLLVILALFVVLWRSHRRLELAKRAAAHRVETERARLALILDNLPVPVFFQDDQGVLTMVNAAFESFLGMRSAAITGRRIVDLLPADEIPLFYDWDDPLVVNEDGRRTQETTLVNSFDELRKVSIVVTDCGTARDQKLIGAIIDNTEGVNAFEAMQDSLDLMTKVTSQVPGLVFELKRTPDGALSFPWASIGMQQLFDISPLDVENDASVAFSKVHPEDHDRLLASLLASGQRMEPWKAEFRLAREHGEIRWVLGNAMPEREADGAILWHGFVADITEVKAIEEQLRQAKAEAEQANRAKSAFLAAMSHEIRTPMNGVIGMTSLLAQTELDDEQSGYVHTIRHSGDALLVVINDILDFSKIESGRLELESMPFDIAECIEGVVDILAPQAIKKGLAMAYYIDHEVPTKVTGDVTRVRQILVNLVGNAIKFTSEGEVFINVDLVEREGERSVRVTVEDTGAGIPAARADRLFKPFSQVDSSTNRVFGGTGLGLAISKRLTDLMQGELFFESTEGEGSAFFFLLPLDEGALGTRTIRFSHLVAPLVGKRVLVADERALFRVVIASYLTTWGLELVQVEDAAALRARLAGDERFDLLLCDVGMIPPEGDHEARRALEDWAKAGGTRIVAMDAVGRSSRHDWDGFLAKPIKAHNLCQTLRATLLGDASMGKAEPSVEMPGPLAESNDGSLRILLAEDNRVNQRVATMILRKLGYEADITNNGREALEACCARSYDVVLMDVQMPEMDGLEATRAIREESGDLHHPWIIALTANATTGDREQAIENGMNDYLAKPIKVEDLRNALHRFLVRRAMMVGPALESSAG
jgi:signal transduction histidine kinase/DNA-binding response OmpR family regulator